MHRLRVPVSVYTSVNWDLLRLLSSTLRLMLVARLVEDNCKSVYIGQSDGRFTLKIILTVLKALSKWNSTDLQKCVAVSLEMWQSAQQNLEKIATENSGPYS